MVFTNYLKKQVPRGQFPSLKFLERLFWKSDVVLETICKQVIEDKSLLGNFMRAHNERDLLAKALPVLHLSKQYDEKRGKIVPHDKWGGQEVQGCPPSLFVAAEGAELGWLGVCTTSPLDELLREGVGVGRGWPDAG